MLSKVLDIIVPIYNKANYIPELVSGFVKLPIDKCNIIFIDDGSTDSSVEVLKEMIAITKLENGFLHTKKNGGVSTARNLGIALSKSKYIWFFDPDDILHSDALNIFDKIEKSDCDIIVFNYSRIKMSNNSQQDFIFEEFGVVDKIEFLKKYDHFSDRNNMSFIWNKLYKRAFIENMRFDEGVQLSEDRRFNINLMTKGGSLFVCNNFIYIYRLFEEGTLSTSMSFKKVSDIYDTNRLNLQVLEFPRYACKKHILSQVKMRIVIQEKNILSFYVKEHQSLKQKILPFYSAKEMLTFIFLVLHLSQPVYRLFRAVKTSFLKVFK